MKHEVNWYKKAQPHMLAWHRFVFKKEKPDASNIT